MLAPPNRGSINSTHILGTYVPSRPQRQKQTLSLLRTNLC
jgi:hypothetical protein